MNTHLEILSKHDNDWRRILHSFGKCDHVDDIVQEFYLKVYNNKVTKVITNGKPNKVYCWVILRHLYFDHFKARREHIDIDTLRNVVEEDHMELKENWEKIYDTEESVKKSFHWFDKMLWELYTTTPLSMRDIEKQSKISLKTIFNTLKHCREQINEQLWQEENQKDSVTLSKR